MKICPKCKTEFDAGKWNKTFCSRHCANSRVFSESAIAKKRSSNKIASARLTEEQKVQRKKKFLETYRRTKPEIKCIDCGKKISKANKYKRCQPCFYKSDDCVYVLAHYNKNYKRLGVVDSFSNQVFLMSSLEIRYYEWLKQNNIKWRKADSIPYKDILGKQHWYKPDFYLVESNEIIEIKGYFWNNDKIKMKQVVDQNPHLNIKILTKIDLDKLVTI